MRRRAKKLDSRMESLVTARLAMLVGLLDWIRILHAKEIEDADPERLQELRDIADRMIAEWQPLAGLPSGTPGVTTYVDAERAAEVACGWAFDAGMREAERDRAHETDRLAFFLCDVSEEATADEHAAAIAAERARCLAWAKYAGRGYWNDIHGAAKGIESGAPAPREG